MLKMKDHRVLLSASFTALVIILSAGLAACTPQPAAPVIVDTAVPPARTQPPSPTDIPTAVPSPTPAPLELADFTGQLAGMGTNGTMACVTYSGDTKDLEGLTLTADISQGSTLVERAIPSEQIDGKTCFEVVDAKYVSVNPEDGTLIIPDSTIKLEIKAASTDGTPFNNSKQTLDLGKYVQFPFLGWIYDTQKVCRASGDSHKGYIAWDFIPYPTSKNTTIINTPVLSPTEGIVYSILGGVTDAGTNASIIIFSPSTGYLIDLTHEANIFISADGKTVLQSKQLGNLTTEGEIVGMIGAKDDASSMPHTHMEIKILPSDIDNSMDPSEIAEMLWGYVLSHNNQEVDFIKSNLFLDQSLNTYLNFLPNSPNACGNLSWGTLDFPSIPSHLSITIDGTADDWAGYTPVLTDASGDSQTTPIMDFTELYTAKDENYLYLMLKAGNNNGQKLWAAQFYVSTGGTSQCDGADKLVTLDAGSPDAILISDIKSCSDTGNAVGYAGGQFTWGDVIEAKIPLIYLGNPDQVEITKVMGMLETSSGWVQPDTMP